MELPSRTPTAWSRSSLVLALYGGLALIAVAIAIARGDGNIYVVEGGHPWWHHALSPVAGLGVGLLVVLSTRYSVHSFTWARRLHHDFRHLLGELSEQEIFVIAIASSIGEELLFRGALQPALGVLWATAIFGLLHIGPGARFLPWTVSALVIGFVFAGMAELLGDLGGPIVAHFTINFLNLGHIARTELPVE